MLKHYRCREGLPVPTTEPELEPASQQVPTRVVRYLDDTIEIPVRPPDDRPGPHVQVLSVEEARQQEIRLIILRFWGPKAQLPVLLDSILIVWLPL